MPLTACPPAHANVRISPRARIYTPRGVGGQDSVNREIIVPAYLTLGVHALRGMDTDNCCYGCDFGFQVVSPLSFFPQSHYGTAFLLFSLYLSLSRCRLCHPPSPLNRLILLSFLHVPATPQTWPTRRSPLELHSLRTQPTLTGHPHHTTSSGSRPSVSPRRRRITCART